MQTSPLPPGFSSVSPAAVDADHDDPFNLDAWAAGSRDPADLASAAPHGAPFAPTAELPTRSSHTPDPGDRPAWAAMKTKAGKDRKRLPLACIACRRKKIKCSGEKPTCQHCIKARTPCVYKVTQRKAAPRTDYMAMLDKRLKRMEERVIRIVPKEQTDAIPRAVVKPALQPAADGDTSKKRPAGQAFGDAGLDLDGWAASDRPRSPSQLPRTAFFNKLDHGTAVEGADALPSREVQEHLAEVYFDYIYGQSYFLLHKPRYMLNLKAGNIPPYLSLAVCAVSARFSTHPDLQTEPAFLRGEEWAKAAQAVAIRYFDTPNIITVVVFILLSLHGFGACQGGRAFMLSGMAHRMSYSLRLHRDPDHDGLGGDQGIGLDATDREMRRRAMWACFQMDRFTASGHEKPLFAREGYLNALPLPVNEALYLMEMSAPTETLDGSTMPRKSGGDGHPPSNPKQNMGVAAFVVRVIALWGRLLEDMSLGPRASDESGASWPSRSSWQTLSAALREFQSSLPSLLLYTPDNLQFHASAGTANGFLLLHLVYSHCLLFLHRFAFPVIAGQPPGRGNPSQVLETARQTALDAANCISDIVSKSQEHRLTFPFGGYVAYVSSAVHLYGAFSKDPKRQKTAKHNLTLNIKYLSRMKKHWGMYHILTENLKDLYRQYADAARRGTPMPVEAAGRRGIYHYSDWHERYPQGVSMADYEEVLALKPSGKDAALAEKSDLQSVENWVANRSSHDPTEASRHASGPQKKRARGAASKQKATRGAATGGQSAAPKQESAPAAGPSPQSTSGDGRNVPATVDWTLQGPSPVSVAGSNLDQGLQPPFGASGTASVAMQDPALADMPNMGFMGDSAQLWGPNWANFDNELMYSEPFDDWNAILNMEMVPGTDNPNSAAANSMNTDVMWFGDIMQGNPGMPSVASNDGEGRVPGAG